MSTNHHHDTNNDAAKQTAEEADIGFTPDHLFLVLFCSSTVIVTVAVAVAVIVPPPIPSATLVSSP